MNREFLLNALVLVAVNLLIKPIYIFGIDRTVQNTVGSESYGLYFALFNLSLLFQMLNDFGIQNFNSRNLSMHRHLLDKYLPSLLQLKLLLSLGYGITVFLVAIFLGYGVEVWPLLLILTFNQVLNSLLLYLRSNIAALGYYRLDSFLSALDRSVLIVLMLVLLWGPFKADFEILWFAWAQTASLLLSLTVVAALVYRKLQRWNFRLRPLFLLSLLRASFPYALVVLLMSLYTRMDAIMLERMLPDGAREAGVYAGAYRLLDAAGMLGYLMAGLLLPMFSRLLQEGKDLHALLRISFHILFVAAMGLSTAVFFFRFELSSLLYVEADAYWGQVLGFLIWAIVGLFGGYVYGTVLLAKGRLRALNKLFGWSLLLNLSMNLLLIPEYGALGAVAATLLTQACVLLFEIHLAHKHLAIPIQVIKPWNLILFSGLLLALVALLSVWTGLAWPLRFGLALLSTPVLARLVGLLRNFMEDIPLGKT